MPLLQPQLITLEQYEALPEEKRVEVFDGVIYDMASPSQDHQTISIELSTIINGYIKTAIDQRMEQDNQSSEKGI